MTMSEDWIDHDADDWSDPISDGVFHAMPGEDGRVPCCGQRHDAIAWGDWMTAGADRVTCAGQGVQA